MGDNIDDSESNPFLIYVILDQQQSANKFDNKIEQITSYLKLKKNHDIWQNSLLVVSSDNNKNAFSLISGPRIPNKKRGIKSQALFHSVDWEPTLLHFSKLIQDKEQDVDGYDLWDAIIYNKISPRTDIPATNIQITNNHVIIQNVKV